MVEHHLAKVGVASSNLVFRSKMEIYPSLAEGIGLENRQAGQTARGFESLYLLHEGSVAQLVEH